MSSNDIELIIERLAKARPDIQVEQLEVRYPADDDGVWYLSRPDGKRVVQLESSTYNCPFLVEASFLDERLMVNSVDDAVAKVIELLDL